MSDVEQLLNKKNIPFKPAGRDYKIKCLNPDHDDSDPSLRVDSITGIFHCFVCGFKGNIFSYFAEKANILQQRRELFKQKLANKMAENVGLEIPDNAIPYEQSWRGISSDTYKKFKAFEHSDPQYVGRVVVPIYNRAGKIVGFNGRALTPAIKDKYLITPKKAKLPLFPVDVKPHLGRVILVEGMFDMLNLWDKGLTNTICAFGTQKVTQEKLELLKIQGVNGIDIFYDGDEAGQKAAVDVARLIESLDIDTRNVYLKGKDPGELTAQQVLKIKETLYG